MGKTMSVFFHLHARQASEYQKSRPGVVRVNRPICGRDYTCRGPICGGGGLIRKEVRYGGKLEEFKRKKLHSDGDS